MAGSREVILEGSGVCTEAEFLDKILKSCPPFYSQSPLLTDFTLLLNKICLKVVYKEDGALWNLITFKVRKLPEAKIS
jgi:hypothetical protein